MRDLGRGGDGGYHLLLGDEIELAHARQNSVSLADGFLQVVERGKAVRTSDKPGEHRRLREVHQRGWLAEVGLTGCLDSVVAAAKVDPVHVGFQDLFLGQLSLDPVGKGGLDHLANKVLAAERKAVARELLGKSARPLPKAAGDEVAHNGARDSDGIDPVMVIETRVLAREQRIHEVVRDFVEWNDHAVLAGETAVEFSILIVNGRTLRHVANRLQIEGQRPRIEKESDDDPEKDHYHRHFDTRAEKPVLETAARTDAYACFFVECGLWTLACVGGDAFYGNTLKIQILTIFPRICDGVLR